MFHYYEYKALKADQINLKDSSEFDFSKSSQCGSWIFDRSESGTNWKFSANGKTIERINSNSWQGVYLNGSLPTSGKIAFCLRATAAPGRSDLDGVLFGIAVNGINRTLCWEPKEFLVNLFDGKIRGGGADATYHGIVGGASPGDIARLLYDADANTLTYYRNGNAYSNAIPLNANSLNEKANLRFYVMLWYAGQYTTLV